MIVKHGNDFFYTTWQLVRLYSW